MRFTIDEITHETGDIHTVWFRPYAKLRYEAGQFVELTLPHVNPDERGIKHWFTLSSSPTEDLLSITTRNFGDKASSFKRTLFSLKPGDSLQASEAMGDFVLPKDRKRPLLFVAGGIGITPMRSMAKYLQDKSEKRAITLLYAVRDPEHLVFLDLFRTIDAKVITLISSEPGAKRLSAELIQEYTRDDSLIYISGPEPMTEQLVEDLKNASVNEANLVTDYFPGYDDEYVSLNA